MSRETKNFVFFCGTPKHIIEAVSLITRSGVAERSLIVSQQSEILNKEFEQLLDKVESEFNIKCKFIERTINDDFFNRFFINLVYLFTFAFSWAFRPILIFLHHFKLRKLGINNNDKIFSFHDWFPIIRLYAFKKNSVVLLEDGTANYVHFNVKKTKMIFRYLHGLDIHQRYVGEEDYVSTIYLNDYSFPIDNNKKKYNIVNKSHDRSIIEILYKGCLAEFNIKKNSVIVCGQPFEEICNSITMSNRIDVYSVLIDTLLRIGYSECDIYYKPHPRERNIYPDNILESNVLPRTIPMEAIAEFCDTEFYCLSFSSSVEISNSKVTLLKVLDQDVSNYTYPQLINISSNFHIESS